MLATWDKSHLLKCDQSLKKEGHISFYNKLTDVPCDKISNLLLEYIMVVTHHKWD